MDTKTDFSFKTTTTVGNQALHFSATPSPAGPLGPLEALLGRWSGGGFNMIWRPNSTPGQDRFLELNLTSEVIQFVEIDGPIANRGFLQPDIQMFGLTYRQEIKDVNLQAANLPAGLHVEPGIWATVPQTSNPAEVPTVVRMASIPHGTTMIAQGLATPIQGPPTIPSVDITPFLIGQPAKRIPFPESTLANPTTFRTSPPQLGGITQGMLDNPNSVLTAVLASQTIISTMALDVSSDPSTPVPGGGVANTAFLQGTVAGGPNAQAVLITSTFWIESVKGVGEPDFLQLQYTQTVLLNFNTLSWPHVTVGTLRKQLDAKT